MTPLKTCLLLSFLFCSSLFGQSNKMKVGVEMGPNTSSMSGDYNLYHDFSLRFSGGLSFQYNFTEQISIRTSFLFERKGLSYKIQYMDIKGNIIGEPVHRINYDYLTVPLLARFSYGEDNRFFVNAGPYMGYLLKNKEKIEAFAGNPETETDRTSLYNRFDIGLSTGVGTHFPIIDNLLLSLEIRYNLGLKNIHAPPHYNDENTRINSTNLLIGLTYEIN